MYISKSTILLNFFINSNNILKGPYVLYRIEIVITGIFILFLNEKVEMFQYFSIKKAVC